MFVALMIVPSPGSRIGIVELADDPAGRLVDHRPQRRERRHVAAGEGLHRLPDPRPDLLAAPHRARRVLDVEDVLGVLRRPRDPSRGSARRGPPSARISSNAAANSSRLKVLLVTTRTRTRSTTFVERQYTLTTVGRRPAAALGLPIGATRLHDSASIGCGSTIAGLRRRRRRSCPVSSGITVVSADAGGAIHTARPTPTARATATARITRP